MNNINNGLCPHCGYCPTCGRSNGVQNNWPGYPWITYTSGIGGNSNILSSQGLNQALTTQNQCEHGK